MSAVSHTGCVGMCKVILDIGTSILGGHDPEPQLVEPNVLGTL